VDKTYLMEPVSGMPPFWEQRDEKYHNRDLKPKGRDEIREKLNLKEKYWNNNTNELLYSSNFKQRLLSFSKNSSSPSSSSTEAYLR